MNPLPTADEISRSLSKLNEPSHPLPIKRIIIGAAAILLTLVCASIFVNPKSQKHLRADSAPLSLTNGTVVIDNTKFQLDEPESKLAIGNFDCQTSQLVVLRPSGNIYAISPNATEPSEGRLIDQISNARDLRVSKTNEGCDQLNVVTPTGIQKMEVPLP